MINRFLKYTLITFQWTLIAISFSALVFTLFKTISLPLDISYNGFVFFLKYSEPFSILYAATFVVITTIYAIKQMELMKESNVNFVISNERNQWIAFILPIIEVIKEENSAMRIDLTKKLNQIHDYLYKKKYIIGDKSELIYFYDTFLKYKVEAFEQSSNFWKITEAYPNEKHSFSFQTFSSIFILMIDDEKSYDKLQEDLYDIYITDVKKFSIGLVNSKQYAEKVRVMQQKILIV